MNPKCRLATIFVIAMAVMPRVAAAQASRAFDIQAVSIPSNPFIERSGARQLVNFDLLLTSHAAIPLRLVAIRLTVFDEADQLQMKLERNENGSPPAIDAVGERVLSPGGVLDVFQPFDGFDENVHLTRMHFELLFASADAAASPLVLHPDEAVSIDVRPQAYKPAAYCLPLQGLLLVHDGHDFNSHHRRFNLVKRYKSDPASAVSANLYAYDFVKTTASGALFEGDPAIKSHWLTYGEVILAPEDGKVLEAVTTVPENTFGQGGKVEIPPEAEKQDPMGFGNYLKIEHADGRVSWLLHMQPSSISVGVGDRVRTGQKLGKVGFSGDSLFPHLHYNVTKGARYPSQGVPSYFRSFSQVLGKRRLAVSEGSVETGEQMESAEDCR